MIAAILCPGPSLAHRPRSLALGQFPITIAVNRAIDHATTHWLVAGDGHTFYRLGNLPSVGVVTFPDVIASPSHLPPWIQDRFHRVQWRSWRDVPFIGNGCHNWGSICAMALAVDLGATRIELIGCDLRGNLEFDGQVVHHAIADRSADRWQRETAELTLTCAILAARGISVINHTPEGPTPWNDPV